MSNCGMRGVVIANNRSLCSDCETEYYKICERDYEKRKAEGAGVSIYSKGEMEDELSETIERLVDNIKERIESEIGFNGKFNTAYEVKSKSKGILLKFRMKNKGLNLEYDCGEIEGYRGELVACELYFKINGEIVEQTYIEMINADYEEMDEKIMPEREFQLDDRGGDEFTKKVIEQIRNIYN